MPESIIHALAANISTSLNATVPTNSSTGGVFGNGTGPDTSPYEPGVIDGINAGTSDGNPVINFLIGFTIVMISAVLNSGGLNLCKLDHTKTQALPKSQRKADWMRPLWLVGMTSYIASQLFGSTLSLRYLRSDWVAPLGSASLVFNFLFAKWLVGTPVTTQDIRGTALIVLAVILILVFSSINHGLQENIDPERLSYMWTRPGWLAWFALITAITILVSTSTSLLSSLSKSRASLSPTLPAFDPSLPPSSGGGRAKPRQTGIKGAIKWVLAARRSGEAKAVSFLDRRVFERTADEQVRFFEGIGWAVVGGSLAGGCLIFTKAVVKLLSLPDHPFIHVSSIMTVLMVTLTAVMQIICLNKALKCADSTLVVPLFFAGYTILGFVNSMIFLDDWSQYETWVLVAIFLSIGILVAGVVLLSLKKPEPADPKTISASNPHMRLNPVSSSSSTRRPGKGRSRAASNRSIASLEDDDTSTLNQMGIAERSAWEVGSVSDSGSEDEGKDGRGVGGLKTSMGERGGLLFEEEGEVDVEDEKKEGVRSRDEDYEKVEVEGKGKGKAESEDGEDPFGDFEEVGTSRH